MLNQVNHWMDFVGTAVDCALLLRILLLRLHRTYLFITLATVLAVFFDAVLLWLWPDARAISRVVIYSRFLYVIVFPAAAWDVFEEARGPIAALRRLGMRRLVSSLIFAGIFGFILAAFAGSDEQNGPEARMDMLAIVCWAASSTACLAFLWAMRRTIKSKNLSLPRNTSVWLAFYQLSFLAEAAACLFAISAPLMANLVSDGVQAVFNIYDIAITTWCVIKLRGNPSDVPTAPENASL